ncbi:mitochondrial import inner membrane translocase subunit TIM16 [Clydaea vesicula]|uniref:Mitochondrial import inner membrane translocase subunit TIM16 n=1 Tax=Clydaea vesicula TaxID=447962 RepID=A0AAD5TXZ8_9FUNG|nr:mitochondrial import inner membrane translocase subunit TIM16 [Clydaea vesicula]KAJ3379479.1 mitochondrial import inner membrane translocase subunit TIM16 [Lobulomyces angularis]
MTLPRVILQVVVVGTQIFAKAFAESYQAAVANSAKNAAQYAANKSADSATRKTGMTIDEAFQILNVQKTENPKDIDKDEIVKKYEILFKQNDPSTGGSFYLQSKIVRARERLELELNKGKEELNNNTSGEPK